MDITKELSEINLNESIADTFLKDIEIQKYELEKREYLLRIISYSNSMEKLVYTDLFEKYNIKYLEFYWDEEHYVSGKLCFFILDENKERMTVIDENRNFIEPVQIVDNLTDKIFAHHKNFIPEGVNPLTPTNIIIELKNGIKDELLKSLLSKELKSIWEYNKMQLELNGVNESSPKKVKM